VCLQIMTPAEARRDTKNLFHEMSVFALQNLTDLGEEDSSLNSKVQGFCECGSGPLDCITTRSILTSCSVKTVCYSGSQSVCLLVS
jgi:hypothetical protein